LVVGKALGLQPFGLADNLLLILRVHLIPKEFASGIAIPFPPLAVGTLDVGAKRPMGVVDLSREQRSVLVADIPRFAHKMDVDPAGKFLSIRVLESRVRNWGPTKHGGRGKRGKHA
jgi:hypothetical protein